MVYLKDYTPCDGVTDDTVGFNTAANIAMNTNDTLVIPTGITTLNSAFPSINGSGATTFSVNFDKGTNKSVTILGEDNAVIRTNRNDGALLYFYYLCTDCTVDNITFINTTSNATNRNYAIFAQGLGSNSITNFTITNCNFIGFRGGISALGVQGLHIYENVFEAPYGHDNAENNEEPAVFINLADNSNGQCYDVNIYNNVADGFTGESVSTLITKRPMDGFVYGSAYGIKYYNNETKNFCQEHFLLQPQSYYPTINPNVQVFNNKFRLSIPTGTLWLGEPRKFNYGCRIDCKNTQVFNNVFYDFTEGILIYPFDYPSLKQSGYTVVNNKFYAAKGINYECNYAIKIQGSDTGGNTVTDSLVANNTIRYSQIDLKKNIKAISIYDCDKPVVYNNVTLLRNNTLNGYTIGSTEFGRTTGQTEFGNLLLQNDI